MWQSALQAPLAQQYLDVCMPVYRWFRNGNILVNVVLLAYMVTGRQLSLLYVVDIISQPSRATFFGKCLCFLKMQNKE